MRFCIGHGGNRSNGKYQLFGYSSRALPAGPSATGLLTPKDRLGSRSTCPSPACSAAPCHRASPAIDRKSTRLNSSHGYISYAVFCLKKKKKKKKLKRYIKKKNTKNTKKKKNAIT